MKKIEEKIWWLVFLSSMILFCFWLIFGYLRADDGGWLLTEVMANAQDEKKGEFLEIQYFGDEMDLSGLSIGDNQDTDNLIIRDNIDPVGRTDWRISAGDLLIVIDPEGFDIYGDWWKTEEVEISKVVIMTVDDLDIGNGLNNNGEEMKIFDKDKNVLVNFSWGIALVDGKSLEYRGGGLVVNDSGIGHSMGWVKGVEVKEEEEENDDLGIKDEKWLRWWQDGEIPLKINELMINPMGDDRDEWIELANNTDREIDLEGWYLCDSKCALDAVEGGYRIGKMKMPGKGFGLIKKTESGINLNNDTDKIFLYDPNHNWVDAMEYDYNGQEGGSLSWSGIQWLDTNFSSPGGKNTFENEEKNQMQADDEELRQDKGSENGLTGSLELIRGMTDGDKVQVKGVVLVDYGLINQDSLWIGDETAGLMLKGEVLQEFKKSEGILVSGEVDSLKYQKIIRVEEAKTVDVDQLQLNKIAISAMDKFQDRLVKVAGKIKQKTTSESFVLNDGGGEVKVLIKDRIGVDKEIVKIGNWLEVSGIVVMTVDGYKLYPTEKKDIVLVGEGVLPQVGSDWPRLVSLWW